MRIRIGVCLAVLLGFASQLVAQEVTGAAQGHVIGEDGAPVAAVRVTVTGPHLQGTRTADSDARGFFQVLALPPGIYQLRATRIGHRPLVVDGVEVILGRTSNVGELRLTAAPVELDAIVVSAARITLDPVHTTAGGTLAAEDYAALPVDRDYKSLITVLPHVNESLRGDAANVAGSSGLENQYYVDGVNVTDTKTGERATSLPLNFIRAVDVKVAGYEAQYGRALGALVNAVTYSGTNAFETNVFAFVQPGALAFSQRLLPGVSEGSSISYDLGARISGPILRDRLWYSAAVNPRVDRVEKAIGDLGDYPDRTFAMRFATKLTWHAARSANVELSVFGDPGVHHAVGIPGLEHMGITTVTSADAVRWRVAFGGVVTSLRATVEASRSLLLEARLAQQWDRSHIQGETSAGRAEANYLDWVTGSVGGGYGMEYDELRSRTTVAAQGTLALGRHTVVAGAEYEDARVRSRGEGAQVYRLGPTDFLSSSSSSAGAFHNRSPAAYLQDSWRVTDRFTLNAGLRWSAQYLIGASGRVGQRITDEWQPRAGFSWLVGNAGAQRFFASYGRFYQELSTFMALAWFVDYNCTMTNWTGDPRLPGAQQTGAFDCSSREADYAKQIPGLHAENFDEYTLGYERLLGPGARLTVRGIRRQLRSSFQWGTNPDSTGLAYNVLGTPGQGAFAFLPPPKREYTGLEISAEGAARRLRYRVSYVLSRTWGNFAGLYDGYAQAPGPGLDFTFSWPHQATNSSGYLPTDRRHVVKMSGTYTTGFGLLAGAVLTFESGSPISELAAGPGNAGANFPAQLVPRGTSGRTPALWNLDLRLTYDLRLRAGRQARVQADLLHVGNPRGTTVVDEYRYTTTDRTSPNAHYRVPIGYQPPMAVRLGLEITF
jgi:hypothetical protein